jgi:hypothetical protein
MNSLLRIQKLMLRIQSRRRPVSFGVDLAGQALPETGALTTLPAKAAISLLVRIPNTPAIPTGAIDPRVRF